MQNFNVYDIGVKTARESLKKAWNNKKPRAEILSSLEKINFVKPYSLRIIVKKLTKQTIEEAILAYAENDAY